MLEKKIPKVNRSRQYVQQYCTATTATEKRSSLPWLLHDLPEYGDGLVVGHVLEAEVVDLQDHVSGLDPPILGHRAAGHDGPDVDAAVVVVEAVALSHDADAQEADRVHVQRDGHGVEGDRGVGDARDAAGSRHQVRRRAALAAPLLARGLLRHRGVLGIRRTQPEKKTRTNNNDVRDQQGF